MISHSPQHRSGNSSDDDERRIKALVLGYLDAHPTAMDTLDGIAQWWILRQRISIEVHRVSEALAALVREGAIEEHEQGGVRFFRRGAQPLSRHDAADAEGAR